MDPRKQLEFEYAARLNTSDAVTRRQLYGEAYSRVGELREFKSDRPEDRTAGTSKDLVEQLARLLDRDEDVLEIGCGRGYTCMMLASHVRSIAGTDVSEPALDEARAVLAQRGIRNASIENVTAFDLREHFGARRFSSAISIEVVEHLHPEDAEEHFRQVHDLLRPGGKYMIVMPSRLDGPHDITREEYPGMKRAIGFHLNESTYGEVVAALRRSGFDRFASFQRLPWHGRPTVCVPVPLIRLFEAAYATWRPLPLRPPRKLSKLIQIQLVAYRR